MTLKRQDASRGFTLIELLVVIAIIAVLVAILIPSLGRVRQKAKTTVCATHLRGWGQAFAMYCTDFNGRLPLDGGDGTTGTPIGVWSDPQLWFNGLTNYVSGAQDGYDQLQLTARNNGNQFDLPHYAHRSNSMFVCPSATDPASDATLTGDIVQNGFFMTTGYFAITPTGGPVNEIRPMLLCYGMNSQLRTMDYSSWRNYYANTPGDGDINKLSALSPSAYIPLLAEKRIRQDELSPSHPSYNKALTQSKVTANRFTTRHDKGGNIVFADGHVDLVKNAAIDNGKALKSNYYNIPGVIIWNPNGPGGIH